jgi:RND family efflux transporter MFP subunit
MFKLYYPVMALVFFVSCKSKNDTDTLAPLKSYPVITLKTFDTVLHKDYAASIQAIQNVEIRARISGYLDEVFVDEGKAVKKGQVLFQLSTAEYKAEVAKAEAAVLIAKAELKKEELEFKRVKILVEKKVVSTSELELSEAKIKAFEAKVKEALSELNNAQIKLSYTTIKSPYDGVIDRLPMKKGALITEGTLLTTLSDAHKVYTYFNVSEVEYLEYQKSVASKVQSPYTEVELILADGSLYNSKGRLQTMEAEINTQTGSLAFRAVFDNANLLLKHGSSGTVRLFKDVNHAMLIPQKSIVEIQDKNYVFVVDKNNRITMQNFVPGIRIDNFYTVKSGLKANDKILFEGIQTAKDGEEIVPKLISYPIF